MQLQLTTRNLRSLGAAFKKLNMIGQTPKASPSPSDSSSDSEFNHRLARSTKRVHVREDMNTTREISPRPSRPVSIIIPDPFAVPKANSMKPDTPAPWSTSAQCGAYDDHAGKNSPQTREDNKNDRLMHSNAVSHSPRRRPKTVKRKRKAATVSIIRGRIATTPRSHLSRTRCGNGVGIRRRSHFALPRPRSLIIPTNTWASVSHPGSTSQTPLQRACPRRSDNSMPATQEAKLLTRLSSIQPTPNYADNSKNTNTPPAFFRDLEDHTGAAASAATIMHSRLSGPLGPPRTYVDHVRAQRLPPNALPDKTAKAKVQSEASTSRQRRTSV